MFHRVGLINILRCIRQGLKKPVIKKGAFQEEGPNEDKDKDKVFFENVFEGDSEGRADFVEFHKSDLSIMVFFNFGYIIAKIMFRFPLYNTKYDLIQNMIAESKFSK
jgi:hypothetical protein